MAIPKTYMANGEILPKCVVCDTKRVKDSGTSKLLNRDSHYFDNHAWYCESCLFSRINTLMTKSNLSFNKAAELLTGQKVRGRMYKKFKRVYGAVGTPKITVVNSNTRSGKTVKAIKAAEPKPMPKPEPVIAEEEEPTPKVYGEKDNFNMRDLIPKKGGNYIPREMYGTTDIKILETAYDSRNDPANQYVGILVEGKTGCGKTHFAEEFAWLRKLPYKRLNLNGASTPEDLVGSWIPKKGVAIWTDGWLTRLMRFGGLLVLDEINMAQADILAILNSVLDKDKKITLVQKDGETIRAHKDFYVVATMNDSYEGTKPLNEALKDRFKYLPFDYNEKVERVLIKDKKILVLAKKIRDLEKKGEIETPVSTRTLMGYDFDKKIFGDQVATEFFINRFTPDEQQAIREAKELIDSEGGYNYESDL